MKDLYIHSLYYTILDNKLIWAPHDFPYLWDQESTNGLRIRVLETNKIFCANFILPM